jgi:hypothetical protein
MEEKFGSEERVCNFRKDKGRTLYCGPVVSADMSTLFDDINAYTDVLSFAFCLSIPIG